MSYPQQTMCWCHLPKAKSHETQGTSGECQPVSAMTPNRPEGFKCSTPAIAQNFSVQHIRQGGHRLFTCQTKTDERRTSSIAL